MYEAITVTSLRDDDGMGQGNSNRDGQKWLNLDMFLKVELIALK